VEDYLRPTAVKVGILSSHRDDEADWWRMIHGDLAFIICVTAWHRFWSALQLIPKTVQTLLRHSDVKLTLECRDDEARTRDLP
jgi:hypothetical protein